MNSVVLTFKNNIKSVEKLINFDRDVIEIAINGIQKLHNNLTTEQGISNEQLNGKRTLDLLKGFRSHDSLKARYSIINNQAIILLVSYFSSAVADLFREAARIAIESHEDKRVLNEELKLKISELSKMDSTLSDVVGDLLISKNGISFQDMQSIQREFIKYFGIKIEKTKNVNNIIASQAFRHCIAHEAGKINTRLVNQVKGATPRDLKKTIQLGEDINFTEEEIEIVSSNMITYVKELSNEVDCYREQG
jgi:hypothetical protein